MLGEDPLEHTETEQSLNNNNTAGDFPHHAVADGLEEVGEAAQTNGMGKGLAAAAAAATVAAAEEDDDFEKAKQEVNSERRFLLLVCSNS